MSHSRCSTHTTHDNPPTNERIQIQIQIQQFLFRLDLIYRDGVAALIEAGVIDKQPTGKADRRKVQEAYNSWREESGYGLAALSRILALSIDAPKS